MTHAIRPQPGIDEIKLYKGGESTLPGRSDVLKLSSNENPLGPPASAKAAIANELGRMHRYPATDHANLRKAIAGVHGLDVDRIICGVGSDEILTFLCQAYAGPGDEVIHTAHGFSMYRILTLAVGATPVSVPERDRVVDVDAILKGVTSRTRLVFLTNPGNPTGTMIGGNEVARLADALPDHVLLVLDGAYAEYADGYDGGAALVEARENVIMTRTFSKLYGLGGLRVGWGYGPLHVIDTLNRVRGPFNLSDIQLSGAEAAILDREWARTCVEMNARLREKLTSALRALGILVDPSTTNFILARFQDEAEAASADAALREAGILVRRVGGYGFPEGLRITVGDDEGCARIIDALTGWKKAAA